ncbi:MAG: methyltransferase domain-containing protein [Bacteroidota bacterium]
MIDSKYLELILVIDEAGSMSKAAKKLHLTQSALSHRLKKLEDYLGFEVFHRTGNRLLFTEAGIEIRDKAKLIAHEFSGLEEKIEKLKRAEASKYIHGYSDREAQRLQDQASTVAEMLHYDSRWEAGATILEVGCGVGAQTEIIATANPDAHFFSIDIAEKSLALAQDRINQLGLTNVTFRQLDIFDLVGYRKEKFDHVFVCFVLEHLAEPQKVLRLLRSVVKETGTITVIEGDHGSTFFHPAHPAASRVVDAQVRLQARKGGNALIGRELYSLLAQTSWRDINVSPRQIYVDDARPTRKAGFILNTFTAMIEGMANEIVAANLLRYEEVEAGIQGLKATFAEGGSFSYTFFKAVARVGKT